MSETLGDRYKEIIFKKFSDIELIKDIESFRKNNGKLGKVLPHFFKECMFRCKGAGRVKSPLEVLNSEEDLVEILDYIKSKPNFYNYSTEAKNIESFFRNGTRFCRKVANFSPNVARDIYYRYFNSLEGVNVLDTSAGFGARMSAVVLEGGNYLGIDPNRELVDRLNDYKLFLERNNLVSSDQMCQFLCQGSEIYVKGLNNIFDISFTSPPYFNLEAYSNDEYASTRNYNDYGLWLKEFMLPTLLNTVRYLKVGGYLLINIKNMTDGKKYTLFDDVFKILSNIKNLEFVERFNIDLYTPKYYYYNCGYSEDEYQSYEPVMCFRKLFI